MKLLRFIDRVLDWKPVEGKPDSAKADRRRERRGGDSREGRDGSVAIPRREIFVALVAMTNLAILPWCYGGVDLWGQVISLGLSALAFAFLFLPVGYDEWRSPSAKQSFDRVVRCVPFWIGLFLISYMLIQGANPRYEAVNNGQMWVPVPIDHWVRWLPHGVLAPTRIPQGTPGNIGGMNAFREAMMFAPMWLLFVALWCGVRSRRVVLWLVRGVVVVAVALAIFGIGMRASGEPLLYGRIPVSVGSAFGPFLYQNQAGAFFALVFMLAAAAAIRRWQSGVARNVRGGEHMTLAAAALIFGFSAVYTLSFGSAITVAVALVALLPLAWMAWRASSGSGSVSVPGLVIAATLIVALVVCAVWLSDLEPLWQKMLVKFDMVKTHRIDDREPIRAATWMMFNDPNTSKLFGMGAGSYRWLSPDYFARFEVFLSPSGVLTQASYAHCDWLQMLVEWGVVGCVAVAAGIVWYLVTLFRSGLFRSVPALALTVALLLFCAHAFFDFLFFSPPLNLFFAFIAFVALSWAREAGSRRISR